MSEPHPAPDDTPAIDPPRKEAPVSDPAGTDAPSRKSPPAAARGAPAEREPNPKLEAAKPKPVERIGKLRLGVGQRDPFFALFHLALAACCAVAGYGTLLAVRRPPAS
jgi:hypothetical protein